MAVGKDHRRWIGLRTEITAAGRQVVGPEWRWPAVHSRFTRLYAVHGGRATVRSAGLELQVAAGMVVVIPAGQVADYHCSERFDHSWVHLVARLPGGEDLAIHLGQAHQRADARLHDLLAAIPPDHDRDPAAALAADGRLRLVLADLLAERPGRVHNRLDHLRDWVDRHLADELRVADLARIAGCGPDRLRQQLGIPPATWLRDLRLDRAIHLLTASELTLEAIAQRCGLGGRSQLSRLVAARLGCSPRALRSADDRR